MNNYKKIKSIFNDLKDIHGNKIDPMIKESVILLNCYGIITTGSCQGHKNHGCTFPWVHIEYKCKKKLELLLEQAFTKPKFELIPLREVENGKYVAIRIEPVIKQIVYGIKQFRILNSFLRKNI